MSWRRCAAFAGAPASEGRLAAWGRLRVAQLFCNERRIQEQRTNLLASGESRIKLDGAEDWRECCFFSQKEKLAFALAEALTLCPECRSSRILLWYAHDMLDEAEFIELMIAIHSMRSEILIT
ncbi:MAG: hypothetical protein C5B47_08645 [Verrucomicrobia bacterium]|nr:MAG: hypothetical protein C5B47_08645 [Verrucomicrobiota bacterium]